MFSIRFTQMKESFVATVTWYDSGLGGTCTEFFQITFIPTTLGFDRTLDFDLGNNCAIPLNGGTTNQSNLDTVGRQLAENWNNHGHEERRALVSFLASIFVAGASVVRRATLPQFERD